MGDFVPVLLSEEGDILKALKKLHSEENRQRKSAATKPRECLNNEYLTSVNFATVWKKLLYVRYIISVLTQNCTNCSAVKSPQKEIRLVVQRLV